MTEARFNQMMNKLEESKSKIASIEIVNGRYNFYDKDGNMIMSVDTTKLSPNNQFIQFIQAVSKLGIETHRIIPKTNFSEESRRGVLPPSSPVIIGQGNKPAFTGGFNLDKI